MSEERLPPGFHLKKCLGGPVAIDPKTGHPKITYLFFDELEVANMKRTEPDEWPCAPDGEPHLPGSVTERGVIPNTDRNNLRYQTLLRKFFDSKILAELQKIKKHLGID